MGTALGPWASTPMGYRPRSLGALGGRTGPGTTLMGPLLGTQGPRAVLYPPGHHLTTYTAGHAGTGTPVEVGG